MSKAAAAAERMETANLDDVDDKRLILKAMMMGVIPVEDNDERLFKHHQWKILNSIRKHGAPLGMSHLEFDAGLDIDSREWTTTMCEYNMVKAQQGDMDRAMKMLTAYRQTMRVPGMLEDIMSAVEKNADPEQLKKMFQYAAEQIKTDDQNKFDTFDLDSLTKLVVDPAAHIMGEGWIRRGALTLITAGTGLGKSVLVEQLACCIASGVQFLRMSVKKPYKVLLVEAENDGENLKRDILSIVKNIVPAIDPVLVQKNLRIVNAYGLGGGRLKEWLKDQIKSNSPDLVIMDPYQSYVGEAELNSSEAFGGFQEAVMPVIRAAGAAFVLVDHTTKPRDRKGWTDRESVYMAAGHSNKSNFARCSGELTQVNDEGMFRLRFGKNAERTGLMDQDGRVLRDLFIEHSKNKFEPWWAVSALQTKPLATPVKGKFFDAIESEYAKDSTQSYQSIANKVGCSKTAVSNQLSDRKKQDKTEMNGPKEDNQ